MADKLNEINLIEQANAAAARLEKANTINAELIARMEKLKAVSGQADAGAKPAEPTAADKLKADTKDYFKGTAIEKAL